MISFMRQLVIVMVVAIAWCLFSAKEYAAILVMVSGHHISDMLLQCNTVMNSLLVKTIILFHVSFAMGVNVFVWLMSLILKYRYWNNESVLSNDFDMSF